MLHIPNYLWHHGPLIVPGIQHISEGGRGNLLGYLFVRHDEINKYKITAHKSHTPEGEVMRWGVFCEMQDDECPEVPQEMQEGKGRRRGQQEERSGEMSCFRGHFSIFSIFPRLNSL